MAKLSKLITMEEAAKHNTPDDCWVVIDGKIYDVTEYLDDHPGGKDVLLEATGRDATEDFEDAGHSKSAREDMEKYYIGELETSPIIPELEIFKEDEKSGSNLKFLGENLQYLAIPAAVIVVSVIVGALCMRKQ